MLRDETRRDETRQERGRSKKRLTRPFHVEWLLIIRRKQFVLLFACRLNNKHSKLHSDCLLWFGMQTHSISLDDYNNGCLIICSSISNNSLIAANKVRQSLVIESKPRAKSLNVAANRWNQLNRFGRFLPLQIHSPTRNEKLERNTLPVAFRDSMWSDLVKFQWNEVDEKDATEHTMRGKKRSNKKAKIKCEIGLCESVTTQKLSLLKTSETMRKVIEIKNEWTNEIMCDNKSGQCN